MRRVLCILLGLLAVGGCERPPDREVVLAALVRDVMVADTRAAESESKGLAGVAERFSEAPSETTFAAVRAQWRKTLLAWKRAYAFRSGPLVETNALMRVTYWPSRSAAVDALIASDDPLDEAGLEALGADTKGLFAMEHLLFDPPAGQTSPFSCFQGDEGARARRLLVLLSRNVEGYASAVRASLGDGAAYGQRFAQTPSSSLEVLVNQMVDTVETIAALRLTAALELHDNGRLRVSSLEGGRSGTSTEICAVLLSATERLYQGEGGRGIGALVKAVAPAIHERVTRDFAAARAAVDALEAPLEQVVTSRRAALEQAARAARQLEVSLKADVASALGVTLTFSANDGD
jgi:predicted lipoprotein